MSRGESRFFIESTFHSTDTKSYFSSLPLPLSPLSHHSKTTTTTINSGLKLSALVESDPSVVDGLHDNNNNNKHVYIADVKSFLDCKSFYGRFVNGHPISIDNSDEVKLLLPGEMPDAAKSITNSGKSILFVLFRFCSMYTKYDITVAYEYIYFFIYVYDRFILVVDVLVVVRDTFELLRHHQVLVSTVKCISPVCVCATPVLFNYHHKCTSPLSVTTICPMSACRLSRYCYEVHCARSSVPLALVRCFSFCPDLDVALRQVNDCFLYLTLSYYRSFITNDTHIPSPSFHFNILI